MTEKRPAYGSESEFICPHCNQPIGRIVKIDQWYYLVIAFKGYIEAVTDCPWCHRLFEYRQPKPEPKSSMDLILNKLIKKNEENDRKTDLSQVQD